MEKNKESLTRKEFRRSMAHLFGYISTFVAGTFFATHLFYDTPKRIIPTDDINGDNIPELRITEEIFSKARYTHFPRFISQTNNLDGKPQITYVRELDVGEKTRLAEEVEYEKRQSLVKKLFSEKGLADINGDGLDLNEFNEALKKAGIRNLSTKYGYSHFFGTDYGLNIDVLDIPSTNLEMAVKSYLGEK